MKQIEFETMQIMDAQNSDEALSDLCVRAKGFVLSTAYGITHRYLTDSDDEWSIALSCFVKAVQTYRPERGSFSGYASLVIQNGLIDYLRKQKKYVAEIAVDPVIFATESESEAEDVPLRMAIIEQVKVMPNDWLALEIEALSDDIRKYGFSFFDLIDAAPKSQKTRKSCFMAIRCMLDHSDWVETMRRSGLLPIKELEKALRLPRKILERHRRYIIAAVEILSGDYPYLADYLKVVREEL